MADSIPGQKTSRDLSIGLVFIAFDFNGMLLGLAAAQAVFYTRRYWRGDRLFLRVLVPVAVCLEVLHFILFCMSVYDITVTSRYFVGFRELPWMSSVQVIVNSTVVATIQSFYLHRVWSLSESLPLLVTLGVLVAGCWGVGLALMLTALYPKDINTFFTLQRISTALNATIAVSDVLITLALSVLLLKSQIEGTRSQKLVKRLVLYTINTGALTSLCALLSLLTNLLMGETEFYILFYYIGTRLYSNSMIASLNARQSLRAHMGGLPGMATFSDIASHPEPGANLEPRQRPSIAGRSQLSTHSLRGGVFRSHPEPLLPPPPPKGKEKGIALASYEDGAGGGPSEHYLHVRIPTPSTRIPTQ